MSVLRFLYSSVLGRIFSILIMLAIGGIYLLVSGDDEKRPPTEKLQIQDQIVRSTDSLDETASAADTGVAIYNAELQLQLKGLWDRFKIKEVKSKDGNLAILTGLPEDNAATRHKAAVICRFLLKGDPSIFPATTQIAVATKDLQPINATVCLNLDSE